MKRKEKIKNGGKYFYYVIVYVYCDDGESVLSCKGLTLGPIIKPGVHVHYSFAIIHFK